MRKLIHSKFELDLTPFKVSDTEENNWFSDSFFTKYSFPFNIDLTEDLDVAFGFISFYNSSPETYFELLYVHNNKIETAVFEIESHQEQLSCTVRFGFEQLPSFDKKLSELSLDKFVLPQGTTIYAHAESVITQTFPAVNYNFPQVHVDKFDVTEPLWNGFQGIINNRVSGAFLTNTIDTVNHITYNRNVMQPLPYWLHILQRGMIDAGYTLSGKILQDTRLIKATLFGDVIYHVENVLKQDVFYGTASTMVKTSSVALQPGVQGTNWKVAGTATATLKGIGKFRFWGSNNVYPLSNEQTYYRIKINGQIVYERILPAYGASQPVVQPQGIEFNYESTTMTSLIEIACYGRTIGDFVPSSYFNMDPIDLYQDGTPFATVINENKVDLTAAVPDITFGDFVKIVKNWFNYDLDIVDNLAVMNPIEDEINYANAEDLQFTEIKRPLRKFSQGSSFLLKFSDIDNTDFNFLPVFHSKETIVNADYVTNDKTTTIEINALPLPLLNRKGIETAYALEQSESKVFLVPYNGFYNTLNLAQPIEDYLLPAVHLQYWKKWFNFRINSHSFTWGFKAWNEQILNLKAKTKIFAYKKFHIIKTVNRTEIRPNQYEVELETEGLE